MISGDPWSLTEAALREPWRLWTGQFIHWSWGHAAANLLAIAVPFAMLNQSRRLHSAGMTLLLAPVLSLALLPFLGGLPYRGASGLACSLWAYAGLELLREGGPNRGPGLGFLLLLALKLGFEGLGRSSPFGEGWRSLPWAHGLGALLGVGWAFSRRARPVPPRPPDTGRPAPSAG